MNAKDIQDRLRQVTFTSGLDTIIASHARYRDEISAILICDDQGNVLVDEQTGQSLRHEADEEFLLDSLLYDQLPRQMFSGHEQLFLVRTLAIVEGWCYDKIIEALHNLQEDMVTIDALDRANQQERIDRHNVQRSQRASSFPTDKRGNSSGNISVSSSNTGRPPPPRSCANCHEVGHMSWQCPYPFCFSCRISFPNPNMRYKHAQDVHSRFQQTPSDVRENDSTNHNQWSRLDNRGIKRGRSYSPSLPPHQAPPRQSRDRQRGFENLHPTSQQIRYSQHRHI
jgi:hypothetical protein